MIRIYLYLVLIVLAAAASCERTIDLEANDQPPKLVVDASIENNTVPVVFLSTSLNYFNTISAEELVKSFVHDAYITISDGRRTVQLEENQYDSSGYSIYFYTVDLTDTANLFLGRLSTTYNLRIVLPDSSVYTATTTIPPLRKTCDSLWWQKAPNTDDTGRCVLYGLFTDPKGLGDYVRYYTSVNMGSFYTSIPSVADDQVTDGTSYTFQLPKGLSKNGDILSDEDDRKYFYQGDTIIVRFCNIDKASYDFWRTWEFGYQATGNPFSSPVKVISNISNGALGAFCGYASQYKTLIIPK